MIMVNNPKAAAVMDDEDDADALDEEFDSNNVQSLLQEVLALGGVAWCMCEDGVGEGWDGMYVSA